MRHGRDSMVDVENLLTTLRRRNVVVQREGDRLVVDGPACLIDDPALIDVLRQAKPAILAYLADTSCIDGDLWTEDNPPERRPRRVGPASGPRKSPKPPAEILAEQVVMCRQCGQVRVLRAVPGCESGLCHYCWLSGRN